MTARPGRARDRGRPRRRGTRGREHGRGSPPAGRRPVSPPRPSGPYRSGTASGSVRPEPPPPGRSPRAWPAARPRRPCTVARAQMPVRHAPAERQHPGRTGRRARQAAQQRQSDALVESQLRRLPAGPAGRPQHWETSRTFASSRVRRRRTGACPSRYESEAGWPPGGPGPGPRRWRAGADPLRAGVAARAVERGGARLGRGGPQQDARVAFAQLVIVRAPRSRALRGAG